MIGLDVALLILRIVVGLNVAAHGAQKLFGWFNGPGLKGAEGFLGGMLGFRPASFWAPAASVAEFGGGLLLALGLFNPLGAIGIMASQLTATVVVHWATGPWGSEGGYEQTLTNLTVAAAVAIAGPRTVFARSALRNLPSGLVFGGGRHHRLSWRGDCDSIPAASPHRTTSPQTA